MSVQSVERTFTIISYLSSKPKPQSLSAVANACNLPPATAFRLLKTLIDLGYACNENGGFYSLTPKLFSMTSSVVANNSVISYIKPHLVRLSEKANESVHLVMQDGNDILYVDKVAKNPESVNMASYIGMRLPMYCTAAGKALLSTLSNDEITRIFNCSDVHKITPNTITTLDGLLANLEQAAQKGYCIDREENEVGITCIAVAIGKAPDGKKYAFSVSSLTARMEEERIEELSVIMHDTLSHIIKELGMS